MAVAVVVSCPECEKKFKPKGDVQGKKIKCPFCEHPFLVPGGKNGKAVAEANPSKSKAGNAKAKPDRATPKLEEAIKPAPDEHVTAKQNLDVDFNPYAVTNQDLSIRCPNCAQEMASAHAIICTHCGYNTLTRAQNKTKKIMGLDFKRHILYLWPAIGAAAWAVFIIGFMVFNAVRVPYIVAGSQWLELLDSEAMRMWGAVFWLFTIWAAGQFCFKKFIEQPKPDDISLD